MAFCPHCGKEGSAGTKFCPECGRQLGTGVAVDERQQSSKLVVWGYVCGVLSLFILPIGFGIAGVVIGIINLTRGRVGHGIAQIVIALTLGTLGAAWGAMVWGV